jgi:hypothetical protein
MDAIVQAILNFSKLEVQHIRITNPKQNEFNMFITVKVTGTGPVGSTMSPMLVDMIGAKGTFGKLQLPEVKTKATGVVIDVPDQKIEILDMDAFLAFVESIQLDKSVTMMLDNGKGTIKALGLTSNITYKKKVDFLGMNGPKTEVIKTEDLGDGKFKNTMKMQNPSPVEIELGTPTFVFKDAAGNVLAEQSGKIHIPRGEYEYESTGTVKTKGDTSKVMLVGVTTDQDAWTKKSIQFFDLPITLTQGLVTLAQA